MRSCVRAVSKPSVLWSVRAGLLWFYTRRFKSISGIVMVVNGADCDVPQKNNPELTDTHYIIHTAYVKTDTSRFFDSFLLSSTWFCVILLVLFLFTTPCTHDVLHDLCQCLFRLSKRNITVWHIFKGNGAVCGDSFYIPEICSFSQSFSQIICCFVHSAAHNNAIDIIRTHTHKRIHRP